VVETIEASAALSALVTAPRAALMITGKDWTPIWSSIAPSSVALSLQSPYSCRSTSTAACGW
jgi:hypothetical protein